MHAYGTVSSISARINIGTVECVVGNTPIYKQTSFLVCKSTLSSRNASTPFKFLSNTSTNERKIKQFQAISAKSQNHIVKQRSKARRI